MKTRILLLIISACLTGCTLSHLFAQDSLSQSFEKEIKIPEEIVSRIPGGELSSFLLSRERVINQFPERNNVNTAFEEIGVSKEVLSRIPGHDLFRFLEKRGYVELAQGGHINNHSHSSGPSPEQVFRVLYLLIGIFSAILVLTIILSHRRKTKDQEIIIQALKSGEKIPYEIFNKNRRKSNFSIAIILIVTGLGIALAGTFNILPPSFIILPIAIGLGFFISGLVAKDGSNL